MFPKTFCVNDMHLPCHHMRFVPVIKWWVMSFMPFLVWCAWVLGSGCLQFYVMDCMLLLTQFCPSKQPTLDVGKGGEDVSPSLPKKVVSVSAKRSEKEGYCTETLKNRFRWYVVMGTCQ